MTEKPERWVDWGHRWVDANDPSDVYHAELEQEEIDRKRKAEWDARASSTGYKLWVAVFTTLWVLSCIVEAAFVVGIFTFAHFAGDGFVSMRAGNGVDICIAGTLLWPFMMRLIYLGKNTAP